MVSHWQRRRSNQRVQYRLVLGALLALLITATPLFARTSDRACFRRGVAIHNMMNWAAVDQTDRSHYVSPAFVGGGFGTSDALLGNVAAAGFDFIRLTVDPGPFLQFTGAMRSGLDHLLIATVERMIARGFCVLVDFHPNSQVPEYAPEKLVQATDDPLFVAYAEIIKRTAELLNKLDTNRVALELMNEPQYGWDAPTTARWQLMLEQLHRAARNALQIFCSFSLAPAAVMPKD